MVVFLRAVQGIAADVKVSKETPTKKPTNKINKKKLCVYKNFIRKNEVRLSRNTFTVSTVDYRFFFSAI